MKILMKFDFEGNPLIKTGIVSAVGINMSGIKGGKGDKLFCFF